MQGKDVPTVFKRRRDSRDEDPAAYQLPAFAPMYPGFFMFDGNNIYPQAPGFPPFSSMPGAFPSPYALQTVQPGSIVGTASLAPIGPVSSGGSGSAENPRSTASSGGRRTRRRRNHYDDDGSAAGDEDSADEQDSSVVETQLRGQVDEGEVFAQTIAQLRGGSSRATLESASGSRRRQSVNRNSSPPTSGTIGKNKGKARADQPLVRSGEAAGLVPSAPRGDWPDRSRLEVFRRSRSCSTDGKCSIRRCGRAKWKCWYPEDASPGLGSRPYLLGEQFRSRCVSRTRGGGWKAGHRPYTHWNLSESYVGHARPG